MVKHEKKANNEFLHNLVDINPKRRISNIELDDLVPYVGLPETDDLQIREVKYRPYKEVKGRNVIKNGDVLFARIEPSIFNRKFIYADGLPEGYAYTSTEFYVLKAKGNVRPKFLLHMLLTDYVYNQFQGKTTGSSGRRRLDKTVFENLLIPYYSIKDQDDLLKNINTAYTISQQKEAEAQKLLDSINDYLLQELGITLPEEDNSLEARIFTVTYNEVSQNRHDPDYYKLFYKALLSAIKDSIYPLYTIESLTEFIESGKTPASSEYIESGGVPIIKVGSYTNSSIDLSKVSYSTAKPSKSVKAGDIFVLSAAHQAEYVGKHIKYLSVQPQEATSYVGELICIRSNEKTSSMFLFSVLNLDVYKTLINREKRGQTSHVYSKDLKNIQIPLPPLEKQNEIATHIQGIREQAKQLQEEAKQILAQAKQEVEKMILG